MFKSLLECFKRLMPKEWVAEIVNLKAISSTIYISKVHNVEMSRTKAYIVFWVGKERWKLRKECGNVSWAISQSKSVAIQATSNCRAASF